MSASHERSGRRRAEKDVARAEADLTLARASKDTIALKQQQVRALQASRRAAVGQLAEAQANLAERQIVAPTNGTILSRPVEVGDVVSPGSPVFHDGRHEPTVREGVHPRTRHPEAPAGRSGGRLRSMRFRTAASPRACRRSHDQAEFTPKNVETAEERLKLVFGVELTFVNPDRVLKPGMPADCVIHWTSSGAGRDPSWIVTTAPVLEVRGPVAFLRPLHACGSRAGRVVRRLDRRDFRPDRT